ncbi:MAG: His/Gly/Thr/Pro-type tRNA ligase C-terminal domain-containing protein [Candidatus Pacebacteria bacterium]|nr:His/Gly/Thr/Pro-type tRNA ligase C-terminal domain-containing protein [Candidatus Paceibacterota bacterium]
MLYSKLFSKTAKTAPSDADSINARLLIRAGFIHKQMAGVYAFLPLGLMVLNKIQDVIREEMEKLGALEILMPALTQEESWEKSGRGKLDILYHLQGREGAKFVLNPTHEEVITPLAAQYVASYRDLPFAAFQFQDKFRDEPRAKSGLLRTREFIMKDLYSFHADKKDLIKYYNKVMRAYSRIFQRLGIGKQTILTLASGGSFSKYSHEFQTISEVGEDTIYLCEKCREGINQEVIIELNVCQRCGNQNLRPEKAVEVGNIFMLGSKFSRAFGLTYKTPEGKDELVEMGCYGIGPSRVMGVIVEMCHDEKGIIWPQAASPFGAHLLAIGREKNIYKEAEKVYRQLSEKGIDVLYDDRTEASSGEKFADADLIGIPLRIVISEKTLAKKSAEIKKRNSSKAVLLPLAKITEISDLK